MSPTFRQNGWPIGSGMVESANKLVIEARLKGAGMHWDRTNVNPMLTLHNGVCNERGPETWQVAVSHHRHQRIHRRTARAAQCAQSVVSSCEPLPLEAPPPAPPNLLLSSHLLPRASSWRARGNAAWFLSSFCPSSLEKRSSMHPEKVCKNLRRTPHSYCSWQRQRFVLC